MKIISKTVLFWIFILSTHVIAAQGDLMLLQDLKGNWLFSIGNDDLWLLPDFDDSGWENIKVPSSWENQGFNGYNGYAFYRKKFTIPASYKGRLLYLSLGYIDDIDEAYVNGQKIGSSGSFPPDIVSAYNARRRYIIPDEVINFGGSNIIAVRVYDAVLAGGIVSGVVGIYGSRSSINFDINLQTTWKFKTGDNLDYAGSDYNDSGWEDVFVPAYWDDQGYSKYDGYAWYRKSFVYQGSTEKMVLVMGKIDDIDQVYINGALVGSTGNLPAEEGGRATATYEVGEFRGYYIPDGLLKKDKKNTIAVRVYDKDARGGIYEGPVGLISQTKYIEYWKSIRKSGN